ncbi:hypothetical protein [Dyella sp.]|jgi:hypothetical protein|uniref:hypothetical protein n=1 Tax=Dyella sp. TaxID=1869338 RepID=UPI002D7A26C4|nr:hypothetical protein [Dyella sp.]HET6431106.1 hypothetical protein [Dyella sp.]
MTSQLMLYVTSILAILLGITCAEGARAKQMTQAEGEKSSACTATSIAAGQPWILEYSFGGGIMPGTGTIILLLSSNGKAVVTVEQHKKKPTTKTVTIPQAEMKRVAKTLAKWPPECIHTVLRKGYIAYDFGRYSIKFNSGSSSSTTLFDECHAVDNVDGFQAIYDSIQSLAPYVGKEITWSSGASTSVKGDMCAPKSEAPNQSSKRTRETPRAA